MPKPLAHASAPLGWWRPRGPLGALVDLFSSVWLGIALLSFLFIYMSIGSAGYIIRQMRWFEMTEYEWFHWWPFNLSIALLCINLTVTTLRRIPFTVERLGVWMIHSGIIVLCIGSVWYFGAKVEGDAPVFRRSITINDPRAGSGTLVALPGASLILGEGNDARRFEVVETRPDWPILSGEHEGERTYSVSVRVESADGRPPIVRQLLDGYPQYTEDLINNPEPGGQPFVRAVKATGERLADDSLEMGLAPWAQEHFYLVNTWALYSRPAGEEQWLERPIRGMPRYNDYLSSREDVWLPAGEEPPPIDPLDLRVREPDAPDALAGLDVRITGFLRYAVPQTRMAPGGDALNPAATIRIRSTDGRFSDYELAAFDPAKRSAENGSLIMRWIDDEAEFASVGQSAPGEVTIRVLDDAGAPVGEATMEAVRPTGDPAAEPPYEPTGIEGVEWRIREMIDGLPLGDGAMVSGLVVDIRTPTETISRFIADDPALTRDFEGAQGDGGAGHGMIPPTGRIETAYRAPEPGAPLTIVAGPDPTRLRLVVAADLSPTGAPGVHELTPGEAAHAGAMFSVQALSYSATARPESRPMIVPTWQRDKDAGTTFSMARVEVSHDGRTASAWLPFNQYAMEGPEYAYGGRFSYRPVSVRLPNGRAVELMLSRERDPLPAPATLEDFRVIAHVGGFTGQVSSIRDWESVVRFEEDGGAMSEALSVRTNSPFEYGGFRFFQAMWDPPSPGFTPGLNFTGLGVGNRKGVLTQLAGCTLAVVGMMYAFYVKPAIRRRRAQEALEAAARQRADVTTRPVRTDAAERPRVGTTVESEVVSEDLR